MILIHLTNLFGDFKGLSTPCVRISGSKLFNFSVQPFTTEDLNQAKNQAILNHFPRPFYTLNLDPYLMGVGGDDTWTAVVHEEYLLHPNVYNFQFKMDFFID
jgi:beta-galactosidase